MNGAEIDFRERIAQNKRATWLLMFAFFLLLALVAVVAALALGGGWIVAVIGVALSFVLATFSYRASDRIAISSTGAVPADIDQYQQLHNVIEEMSIASGLPKPRVYIVNDMAPNAFATGRDPEHAAVAVTTGLLAKMNRDELQGVLAHELAHIRNYDIRVMTVAVATAGAIALITDIFWRMLWFGGGRGRGRGREGGGNPIAILAFIVVLILAPLAAAMLKAAISRRREALADASAVEMTRYPAGLRKALEKLDADSTVVRRTSHATSHLWIETPDAHEPGQKGRRFNDMFDTHPPLRERIDLLRAMEGLPSYPGPDPDLVMSLRAANSTAATEKAINDTWGGAGPSAWDSIRLDGTAPPTAAGARPGWYTDPAGTPGAYRYWDGAAWTRFTHIP